MTGQALVGVVMGSRSDYAVMRAAVEICGRSLACRTRHESVSAHNRTPDLLFAYAAGAVERGLRVTVIAGAFCGAAHLPGSCWRRRQWFRCLACRSRRRRCRGWIRCSPSCKCRRAFRWERWRLARRARSECPGLLAVGMLATTDRALQQRLLLNWRRGANKPRFWRRRLMMRAHGERPGN